MDELAKQIAELASKIGQPAMDAARGAVRIEAYSTMAGAGVWLVVSAFIFWAGTLLWKCQDDLHSGVPQFFAGLIFLIGGVAVTVSVWQFVDPWTWTAINNPDLYLAKKILKL